MRASHPLLVLFLGFFAAVIVHPPGRDVETQSSAPEKVVHTWPGKRPAVARTTLRGQLIDLVGTPVADAALEDCLGGQATKSGPDGRFELTVAAHRCLDLLVKAAEGIQRFTVLPEGKPVRLVVRPERPWLAAPKPRADSLHGGQGLIKEGQGRIVVTVRETGASVCADEFGKYRVPVPSRTFHLVAHDEAGRVAVSDPVAPPRDGQRWMPLPTMKLVAGHRAGGYVRNPQGKPLADAALLLKGPGAARRFAADDAGAFEVKGLAAGTYSITALPQDGWVGASADFEVGPGAAPADLELSLQPELPFELDVIDESGAAQVGVYVQATAAANNWSAGQTDATGHVVLRGLSAGDKEFAVYRKAGDGYQSVEVVRFDATESQLVVR